jgi:YD repeat-containing protein
VDGVNLGSEDTSSPYSAAWNSTTSSNGSHTLTAVARDAAGNVTTSAPVTVTVNNTAPSDTTPPSASMTAPASGATVSSSVTVSATASDNVGVVGVQFLLDGTALGAEDTSSPYSIAWNTTTASNGAHTLAARARDAAGNSTTSSPVTVTVSNTGGTPSTRPLLQQSSLTYLGSFRVPAGTLGSTYGFNAAGTGGLGTYAMAFNAARNSLFLGGHPYEQRVAELAIPSSLTGTPTATALQNLIDPLEGRLGSINPSDPNSKVIGSALVYNNQLFIGAFSYYDGAATQSKSEFVRPVNLSTTGQVIGPVKIGANYPGWVDKYASLIPAEWQASFGGPALAGGTLGAINSLQSWGPSATVFDPANVTTMSNVPGTLVLGYPYGHPLADTMKGNQYLSQADFITGMVFPTGTRSVLFFGKHGLGDYCYGTGGASGGACYDPDDSSKGIHSYPYRSQVWAYDANDLIAVKSGVKQSYDVAPYAVWQLDAAFVDIQGVAYDAAAQRLYVSRVYADNTRPLINVYQIVVP